MNILWRCHEHRSNILRTSQVHFHNRRCRRLHHAKLPRNTLRNSRHALSFFIHEVPLVGLKMFFLVWRSVLVTWPRGFPGLLGLVPPSTWKIGCPPKKQNNISKQSFQKVLEKKSKRVQIVFRKFSKIFHRVFKKNKKSKTFLKSFQKSFIKQKHQNDFKKTKVFKKGSKCFQQVSTRFQKSFKKFPKTFQHVFKHVQTSFQKVFKTFQVFQKRFQHVFKNVSNIFQTQIK